MATIGLSDDVYDKISLLASAWDVAPGQVIARLLVEFQHAGRPRHAPDATSSDAIAIHALYEGARISANFDPITEQVTITSGPLAGQSFRSPSGAAGAQVGALKPSVMPNRNGWGFWYITETGELLQALRRR